MPLHFLLETFLGNFPGENVKIFEGILGCLKINLLLCTLFYGSSLKAEGKDAARGDMRTEMAAIKTLVVNFIDKR